MVKKEIEMLDQTQQPNYSKYLVESLVVVALVLNRTRNFTLSIYVGIFFIIIMYLLDKQKSIISSSIRSYMGYNFVQFISNPRTDNNMTLF